MGAVFSIDDLAALPPAERYGPAWRSSPSLRFGVRLSHEGLRFEAVNAAFEAAVALPSEALVGKRPEAVLPAVAGRALGARLRRCLALEATTQFVQALAFPGARRFWEMTLTPVSDVVGGADLVLGRARDVTVREERELAQALRRRRAAARVRRARIHFTAFPDGRLDHVSPQFFAFTGLPAEASPEETWARLHPDDAERLRLGDAELLPDGALEADARVRRHDGAYRRFQIKADLFDGPVGRRWYGAATGEKSAARRGAAGDDEHLFGVIASLGGCGVTLDRAWRITAVTPAAAAWIGLTPPDMLGLHARDDLTIPQPLVAALEQSFLTGRPSRVVFPAVLHPGRWGEYQVFPTSEGATLIFWDVTEQQLEDTAHAAPNSPAAVAEAAHRLLTAQEEERQRIAMELHDSTGQHLVALGLGVARLRRTAGLGGPTREVLEDMTTSIQQAIKEIRILSYLMKPPGLEENGLESAARGFVKGFAARTGLEVVFTSRGDVGHATPAVRHAAFRVLQEALSNVYRHARATCVEVELDADRMNLVVRVADNGRGVAALHPGGLDAAAQGVGISGMRERAAQLGGAFDLASSPAGTTVRVSLPRRPSARPPRRRSARG